MLPFFNLLYSPYRNHLSLCLKATRLFDSKALISPRYLRKIRNMFQSLMLDNNHCEWLIPGLIPLWAFSRHDPSSSASRSSMEGLMSIGFLWKRVASAGWHGCLCSWHLSNGRHFDFRIAFWFKEGYISRTESIHNPYLLLWRCSPPWSKYDNKGLTSIFCGLYILKKTRNVIMETRDSKT